MKRGTEARRWAKAALARGLALAAFWVLLTDGAAVSAPFGAVVVALATGASLAFSPPAAFGVARPADVVSYAVVFVRRSLLAGVDVARRALHPRLPIDPVWRHYPVRLPPGRPRAVLLGTITLLPGTLSAEMEGGELWVHVLDAGLPVDREFAEWEQRVARLFAIELPSGPGRSP